MRVAVVSLILLVPLLAGCLGDDSENPPTGAQPRLAIDEIRVPAGAELIEDATGAILRWTDIKLPFKEVITVPNGTTLVSAQATIADDLSIRTYMSHNETGRRRCNPDALDAWNIPATRGAHACSGLAAIDPAGSEWKIQALGAGTATTIQVVYDARPLDGLAARLDLTKLSMPTWDIQDPEGFYIDSFDGTPLWVEVTLPEGEGPFPTIIGSSPYNGQTGRLGQSAGKAAMWEYFTHDWAKRGYAIVNVDVRGFGLSGGCVEVWGENEQKDQVFIVDWVAGQEWSDGKVGFYGQSYVGTTPVAAAVQAPEALKAIIAVAPVINAYEDWHHGGVPNGENTLSPVAYQVLTDMPPIPAIDPMKPDLTSLQYYVDYYSDPATAADNIHKGVCDPTLVGRANDPRAVYDDYYRERDFKLRADQVTAAVLFTQGFEDSNVKSAMIPGWFNDIQSPKLGLFGHWVHQHPTRADEEIMFLGWMDQYVKGVDLGFDGLPAAEIATNVGTVRQAEVWPDSVLGETLLWPDLAAGTMSTDESTAKGATLMLTPTAPPGQVPVDIDRLRVSYTLSEDLAVSGIPALHIRGTLENKGNAYLAAQLFDKGPNETALVSYGMFNLAHEDGHDTWNAVTGPSDVTLPFLPTEHVFQAGHTLEIVLYGVAADELAYPGLGNPTGAFTFGAHPDGMGALHLPTVPMTEYQKMPRSAAP
ncbi:MAG: CocE/NonD family hydrolase [Euryarchaeota archaeon]|nr:CocE/NonD family hydrolase [Euryarchaeota archaeon]